MVWDEEQQDIEFKSFIQKLIQLRRAYPECNYPYLEWIDVAHPHVVAFRKGSLQVVVNNSDREAVCAVNGNELTLPAFGFEVRDLQTLQVL